MSMNDNTRLWEAVCVTDPGATKAFKGKGGFSGTAIKPLWLIRRATETWGPIGGRWGVRIINEKLVDGHTLLGKGGEILGITKVHQVQIELYYPTGIPEKPEGVVPGFGQTEFCGIRSNGAGYTDEDAPKKSLTDAITKALSWLGFGADVHMGRFDDSRYVDEVRSRYADSSATKEAQEQQSLADARALQTALMASAKQGRAAFEDAWKGTPRSMREHLQKYPQLMEQLKKEVEHAAAGS